MIYYYGQPHPAPSGGMIVQLQHAQTLCQASIPATFLVEPGYRPKWIDLGAYPVTYQKLHKVKFAPGDVLVVPEYVVHEAQGLAVRKVAHVQNWGQVRKALDVFYPNPHTRGLDEGATYEGLGYAYALTCGGALTRILQEMFGVAIPILTVTNYVDVPDIPPRKRRPGRVLISDVHSQGFQVWKPLWDFYSALWGLSADLRVLGPVPREAFLGELCEADVYLHIKYPEGMPLKPIEALRLGAVVVGFAGGGGLEYMQHEETALVAPDGDFHALLSLLRRVLVDAPLRETLRKNGREASLAFSYERYRAELLDAWTCILEAS